MLELPEPINPYGKFVTPDRIVAEVTAAGQIPGLCDIEITFDEEASVDLPDRTVDVLPCNGRGTVWFADGRVVPITSQLPRTVGRPGGPFGLGWFYYVIDEVNFDSFWHD